MGITTTELGQQSREEEEEEEEEEENGFHFVVNDKEENAEFFNSKEEAFSYYKDYAKSLGFAAIIKASRRSRISGNFIDAKFACTKYGNRKPPQQQQQKRGRTNLSWAKTDCKACMHVKRRHDGRWIISNFIKDHNHQLFPNNNNTDLGLAKKAKTTHVTKKCSNKVENGNGKRRLAFHEGDLRALLGHFVSMQEDSPNFFYAVDFNEEQELRGVFWVDAKGRVDYGHFGDVVLLDTLHVRNEYKLPVVPFIGVNHHSQFLLLGLGLVCDESKATYVWLMRVWLRAMGGLAPKVILTDRDWALREAVAEVFPESCHCFCLWHVLSKVPERLDRVTMQHGEFMAKFKKCVLNSGTREQFEKRWWKMVEKFELGNEGWLCSIYEDRKRWIPVYMKGRFLAGMSTLQRPEGMSCFLEKHMQRKTTLKEFFEQYKAVLRDKCEEEAKADLETMHKQPALKSPSPFGKQMVKLYTHAIFKRFQGEVLGAVACHPRKESEDGPTKAFRVQDFEGNQNFTVMWNEFTSETLCSCYSFELNGFLCRHVMIVLQISGVHNIPSRYILKRWTKDAKNRQTASDLSDVVDSRDKRYNNLCQLAFELGDRGSLSQESYIVAVNALEESLRKCESLIDSVQRVTEPNSPNFGSQEVNLSSSASHTNKKNSTSKKRQVRPEPEIIATGINSSWQQMENPNTRAAGLDCSYESQLSIQEMNQLNSRAQNLDGYFATQQIGSGTGQLNSIAPVHDAHYIAPQRMHGVDHPNGGSVQLHGMGVNVKQLNSRHPDLNILVYNRLT